MHNDFRPVHSQSEVELSGAGTYVGSVSTYYLQDWLDLHGLTARHCADVLSRAEGCELEGSGHGADRRSSGLSGEQAWMLAAEAMRSSFPHAAELIGDVRHQTVRTFGADRTSATRPFTILAGDNRPMVFVRHSGRIADMLTIAHEFGHALQAVASGGGFVPPVDRELAAFLSELALLRLLATEYPELHRATLAAWRAANRSYLVRDGKALAAALEDRRSVYRYAWNYPIARVLASECAAELPVPARWAIFEHRLPLPGLVSFLGCARRNSRSCDAACLMIA